MTVVNREVDISHKSFLRLKPSLNSIIANQTFLQ
jgi:hypothetical protein